MKYNRYLPILIPLLVWLGTQIFLAYPTMIYVVMVVSVLLIFFALWQFARASSVDKAWWNFMILPALMVLSVIVYSSLQSSDWFVQILLFLDLIICYLFFRFSYYYLLNPAAYKISSIENLSLYGNFLIFFFIAASLFGFQSFLSAPAWLSALAVALFSSLIVYQVFWANKIRFRENLFFLFVIALILAELTWAISFLSLDNNIAGFTLAIFYYMMIGLARMELISGLSKDKLRLYLGFGFASIIIILLTARWF
jgi:hypothetical protein